MSKSCESCAVKKTTRVKRMAVRVTTAESWRVVRIVSQSVAKLQKFRRGTHREIASLVIDCSITFSGSCVTLPWLMSPFSLSLSFFLRPPPHLLISVLVFFLHLEAGHADATGRKWRGSKCISPWSQYVGVRDPDEIRKRREGGKEGERGRQIEIEIDG